MSKKSCATMMVLTFCLLLTAPAFAESTGSAAQPASSGVEVAWTHRIDSWLQTVITRIEQALKGAAAARGVTDLDSKPGKPEPSDPGMTLIPMDGADGDPNG